MNTPRTIRTFLVVAGFSGAALLAAGMLALAEPEGIARADGPGWGMHGYGPPPQAYGWHGSYRHGGPCGDRAAGMLGHLDGVVPDLMNLDTKQQKAWDDLMASAESARTKLKDACADRSDRANRDATAPERLARMEKIMAAGLDGVHEVQPRLDTFYAALSERQRQGLDELLSHRGRPFGAMHDGMGDGTRDKDKTQDR